MTGESVVEDVAVEVSNRTVSACSAAIAGAMSTAILHPLDTVKTRMQSMKSGGKANGEKPPTMTQVFNQLRREGGLAAVYAGVYVKALQSSMTKSMYFYVFSFLGGGTFKSVFTELFMGYMAELMSLPLMMPLETVGNKMICSKTAVSPTQVISNVFKSDGVMGFYNGFNANIINAVQPAIHFGLFEQIKKSVLVGGKTELGFLESFAYGGVARAISTLIFYPTIRAKVIAQANPGTKLSPMEIISAELKNQGVVGLYVGVQPELIRGVLSTALTMAIKERVTNGVQAYLPLLLALFYSKRKKVLA
eukprot:m.69676 g.69676  ORF g.69676 m.69676 type:complete len:306 (-) comp24126_c0_seq1:185-1102(-)